MMVNILFETQIILRFCHFILFSLWKFPNSCLVSIWKLSSNPLIKYNFLLWKILLLLRTIGKFTLFLFLVIYATLVKVRELWNSDWASIRLRGVCQNKKNQIFDCFFLLVLMSPFPILRGKSYSSPVSHNTLHFYETFFIFKNVKIFVDGLSSSPLISSNNFFSFFSCVFPLH